MDDQFILDAEYGDMCEMGVYESHAAELATLRAENERMREGKPVSRMTEAEKAIMMLDRGPLARYRAITR